MDKLIYISVPLWQGAEKKGVEKAPQSFIEAGVDSILHSYYDVSYNILPEILEEVTLRNKYVVLSRYMNMVKETVLHALQEGVFPFIVGGDHALGLGTVAAAAEQFDNLGLIWFDAHGDMNTETTSETGHIHGMPVAALMGLCTSELNEVTTKHIKPENIFWIGTRSLDPGEKDLIKRLNLHVYSSEYVRSVGMKQVMDDIRSEIRRLQIKHLHCSIDIDAMDPKITKATGVAEPKGLTTKDYNSFVKELSLLPVQLTSIDFVEYNPLLDDAQNTTKRWCLNAIATLMRTISSK